MDTLLADAARRGRDVVDRHRSQVEDVETEQLHLVALGPAGLLGRKLPYPNVGEPGAD